MDSSEGTATDGEIRRDAQKLHLHGAKIDGGLFEIDVCCHPCSHEAYKNAVWFELVSPLANKWCKYSDVPWHGGEAVFETDVSSIR